MSQRLRKLCQQVFKFFTISSNPLFCSYCPLKPCMSFVKEVRKHQDNSNNAPATLVMERLEPRSSLSPPNTPPTEPFLPQHPTTASPLQLNSFLFVTETTYFFFLQVLIVHSFQLLFQALATGTQFNLLCSRTKRALQRNNEREPYRRCHM